MTPTMLAHDETGRDRSRTVLLLHAGVADRRMWEPQWPALTDAGYRLVRADLRGFGDSAATDGAPDGVAEADEADDVLALLDALGIEQATVVAASYGGAVALELAARSPERVDALLLLATAHPAQEPGPELAAFDEREEALIAAGDLAGAAALNAATWLGPEADAAAHEQVRQMQHRAFVLQIAADDGTGDAPTANGLEVEEGTGEGADGTAADLSTIRATTLAVAGAYDFPDFRQIAAGLANELPDATYRELPWAGHLPSLERPEETTQMMLDFLATTEP